MCIVRPYTTTQLPHTTTDHHKLATRSYNKGGIPTVAVHTLTWDGSNLIVVKCTFRPRNPIRSLTVPTVVPPHLKPTTLPILITASGMRIVYYLDMTRGTTAFFCESMHLQWAGRASIDGNRMTEINTRLYGPGKGEEVWVGLAGNRILGLKKNHAGNELMHHHRAASPPQSPEHIMSSNRPSKRNEKQIQGEGEDICISYHVVI
ncbi:hypothetical protein F5Y09DRAFT_188447 [Xylaria sp. FL1042]|nr:hypothetical protein F5Y09DRAFT_188447 [Xylaria sp. FL1042]